MGIHKTAIVDKNAEIDPSSDIGPWVIIESGARIQANVKIMANVYICRGTEIGEGTVVHMGAVIGNDPQDYAYKGADTFTRIGKNNIIREYVTIHRGTQKGTATIIGDNNFFMVQAHIGHNCCIADNVIIANSALLAGYVSVEKGAFISGNVVFHQHCRIGQYAMIGGFSGVNKDVPPYVNVRGASYVRGINLVGLRRAGFDRTTIRRIKEAYMRYYFSAGTKADALSEIKKEDMPEAVAHFVSFIESSKRGICAVRTDKDSFFD
ncbi:MAG: acyl-ACP--UDP-N-acetylglucosamine O-acyltransferase [Candidatus Omnitrophota bacterium]